jgi:hypothetical protein
MGGRSTWAGVHTVTTRRFEIGMRRCRDDRAADTTPVIGVADQIVMTIFPRTWLFSSSRMASGGWSSG